MATLILNTDAPTITGPMQGTWTYADWERLPADGNRYEVIGGVLYMTTAPSNFHQWILQSLVRYLGIPAMDQGLAYCFPAPIGVLMPGCDPVQPDYVVIRRENAGIIRERRIRGVPDLLIEILSPPNRAFDEATKLAAYATAGVPEYAIIDPAAQTVAVYQQATTGSYGAPTVYAATETAYFACLPGVGVPVGALFAGAPDTTL